jgi:hypothetical protein
MTMRRFVAVVLGLAVAASVGFITAWAQGKKGHGDAELYAIIEAQDAALFEAYNNCNMEKFGSFIDENVEFYHDNGGVTLGRQALVDSVKKNICGKVQRTLVPGTLEVYRIAGYGAFELGVHRFTHPNAQPPESDGEGSFAHLWRYKDGKWQVTRVVSYDHHEVK